jgi:predicted RNA methylase
VWDSTYVLVDYLHSAQGRPYVTGRKMVELGSGTGIAGLSLSSLGPTHMILTGR